MNQLCQGLEIPVDILNATSLLEWLFHHFRRTALPCAALKTRCERHQERHMNRIFIKI
jgi:hypothetical protein